MYILNMQNREEVFNEVSALIKKVFILSALSIGLILLLSLWVFDKIMVLLGKEQSFRFFNPKPYPLNPLKSLKPLGMASAGHSL